ncbi:MAG: 1-(5-phosphoribosyl)-5-[(5-phosphoribosylamino)methylideneamino]imidazole-4-carboxamide isomerase [Candidatus Omnitrophica bacterium]|nr:1-(5-phosphoribosyl)-5-[(5-phosphoribosylamino)methylideneamino]imidazole-4-carboxamide isomerase [Candidatus Omnitrophota bacterium]
MLCIPAIDIRGGKVVRLFRGLYSKETVYADDPAEIARRWEQQGAKTIHVVDLDGAYFGVPKNFDAVKKILGAVKVPVQLGGGLRTEEDIRAAAALGVQRAVLSTKVFADAQFLPSLHPSLLNKITVSIDTKSGFVLDTGWTKPSPIKIDEAIRRCETAGITTIVVTDVSCDGTLAGPNLDFLRDILRQTKMHVIASGGVGSLEDITRIRSVGREFTHLYGLIVGKALYAEKFSLAQAVAACA